MKKCELCKKAARMYCESDQACLCWDCDSKVHTANFIVGKHTRTLLCHACQSPTPWTGSGPKLAPTVSVCEACVNGRGPNADGGPVNRNREDEEDDGDDDDVDDDEEEVNGDCINEEDDSENQVVPLSLPPSSASTSSSSDESSSRRTTVESARFYYNGIERPEEKNSSQNMKSWTWQY